jgi:excisionase family DNA binding protein
MGNIRVLAANSPHVKSTRNSSMPANARLETWFKPGTPRRMMASDMDVKISEVERQRRARQQATSIQQRAMSIGEFCQHYGIGRTTAYEEIKRGRLRGLKVGKRTLITEENAEDWLRRLPAIETGSVS